MKHIYKLLLLLCLPFSVLAQDTTVLKQQANLLAKAFVKGDYKVIIDHMYTKYVQLLGGKEKMMATTSSAMDQAKAQGVLFESARIGSPGKFYKAGTETHCLVPETISMKLPNGHVNYHSYLLAITNNGGKNWTFLDLNKGTIDKIPALFPNFNHNLKIPEPTFPVMMQ